MQMKRWTKLYLCLFSSWLLVYWHSLLNQITHVSHQSTWVTQTANEFLVTDVNRWFISPPRFRTIKATDPHSASHSRPQTIALKQGTRRPSNIRQLITTTLLTVLKYYTDTDDTRTRISIQKIVNYSDKTYTKTWGFGRKRIDVCSRSVFNGFATSRRSDLLLSKMCRY